ncbi:MAG: Ribonuclease precursor [Proteobacteria bacterium]|nr:Ribonuclease precursor [Pseudomonadota bacterium]
MRITTTMLLAIPAMFLVRTGFAFEPLQGELVARTNCPALQSIRKETNPGGIELEAGKHYRVSGRNAPNGQYLQVEVGGARPELRWVPASCGELVSQKPDEDHGTAEDSGHYLLAVSWQPAFCETKPSKTECRTQSAERFDATHFALHGLWPQPQGNVFCGVSAADKVAADKGRWDQLPEAAITPETRVRLNVAMPGTASNLQRHEYTKHGTCFPGNSEAYFRTSLNLVDQLNASRLREVMAGNIGNTLDVKDMQKAFEETFGPGSGKVLEVHCVGDVDSRRTLINEVRIPLKGPLTDTAKLGEVLDTSAPVHSDCNQGVVDPAGLN